MEALPGNSNSWKLYYTTDTAWEAMYEACKNAKYSIKMEQYIFENDECGNLFLELFIKKAAGGVKIFLICDMFGSMSIYNSPLIKKLKENGAEVYFYNKIIWKKLIMPWRCFPRTHVKTLLIDSEIVFTGGVCLAWRMHKWRDTHIRITGPVASLVEQSFADITKLIKKKHFHLRKRITHEKDGFIPSCIQRTSRRARRGGRKRRLTTCAPTRPMHDNLVQRVQFGITYLISQPSIFKNTIYKTFKNAIIHAKQEIYISTSFFVPNKHFMRLLMRASRRGVKIYLLVPEYSDVKLADLIFLSYAKPLLKSGIKIYCYNKSVLHCKTMVVDGNWSTIGSVNMDILSFFYNREANIICTNPQMAAELKRQFKMDLKFSKKLTLKNLQDRPLLKKILGYCGRGLKLFFQARMPDKEAK